MRRRKDFDVVDFGVVYAGDVGSGECLTDGPCEVGERVNVAEGEFVRRSAGVFTDEEKPVAAISHIADDISVAGYLDRNTCLIAKCGDVVNGDFVGGVEVDLYGADGGVDPVLAGLDKVEMSEGGGDTDHAMSAHSEVACIVEEDDASGGALIVWREDVSTDEDVRATGFAEDGAAVVIVLCAEEIEAVR